MFSVILFLQVTLFSRDSEDQEEDRQGRCQGQLEEDCTEGVGTVDWSGKQVEGLGVRLNKQVVGQVEGLGVR